MWNSSIVHTLVISFAKVGVYPTPARQALQFYLKIRLRTNEHGTIIRSQTLGGIFSIVLESSLPSYFVLCLHLTRLIIASSVSDRISVITLRCVRWTLVLMHQRMHAFGEFHPFQRFKHNVVRMPTPSSSVVSWFPLRNVVLHRSSLSLDKWV